jgi:hypothetical protein
VIRTIDEILVNWNAGPGGSPVKPVNDDCIRSRPVEYATIIRAAYKKRTTAVMILLISWRLMP